VPICYYYQLDFFWAQKNVILGTSEARTPESKKIEQDSGQARMTKVGKIKACGLDNSKFALLMYNKASLDIPYEALCEVGPAPKTAL